MQDLDLLEQVDFIEVERREQSLRFLEHAALIHATAKSAEIADKLLAMLKSEYFVGYADRQKVKQRSDIEQLLQMQEFAYKVTVTGAGGSLEITPQKK
jgi:hypothetical protein